MPDFDDVDCPGQGLLPIRTANACHRIASKDRSLVSDKGVTGAALGTSDVAVEAGHIAR